MATLLSGSSAFAPSSKASLLNANSLGQLQGSAYIAHQQPIAVQKQRRSMAPVQTMSLFGLGGPEIAIILVAAAFLLGPQKLAELGKDAGKIAGELKEVPKEFQKGLAEGEAEAANFKTEIVESVKDADKE
eukprot:CAMPEP_0184855572 /NCGR_PEP_ID=MMETSP0580-20130426/775_1 /TAXON_ID=1118495 /ORGANISM="Dactyliosolen fragilissimus" /LENGTH=130 /DNA_ID=CAMNT_0027350117 /DNA_START=74 /DNA_END=466 /DNA_ORIENTATION=+